MRSGARLLIELAVLQIFGFVAVSLITKIVAHPQHVGGTIEPYIIDAAIVGLLSAFCWFVGSIGALIEAILSAPGFASSILNMLGAILTGAAVVLQSPLSVSQTLRAFAGRFF